LTGFVTRPSAPLGCRRGLTLSPKLARASMAARELSTTATVVVTDSRLHERPPGAATWWLVERLPFWSPETPSAPSSATAPKELGGSRTRGHACIRASRHRDPRAVTATPTREPRHRGVSTRTRPRRNPTP